MPSYGSMQKKVKEVQIQDSPQQMQTETRQQYERRSVLRQYEAAKAQEERLAARLRQGPPDHVLKKGKWKSRHKRALEELREQNKETFGTILDEKKVTDMNNALRQERKMKQEEGQTWGEQGIVSVYQSCASVSVNVSALVKEQAPVSSAFSKLCRLFEEFQKSGGVNEAIATDFLKLRREENLQFGPASRFLTEDEAHGLQFAGFSVSEKPEAFHMMMQNALTTALFHCMDQMEVNQINVGAFAALRTASMTSELACAELLNNPEWKETARQKQESERRKEEAKRLEEEKRKEEQRLAEEQKQRENQRRKAEEQKQREELERKKAEHEHYNQNYLEHFLRGEDRYSAGWAGEFYREWLGTVLKNSMDQSPQLFADRLVRRKENLDARLAELQAFAGQHKEWSLGMPMLFEQQCRKLAKLAGAQKLCGTEALTAENLQWEERQLEQESEQENARYRKRQEALKNMFQELSGEDWTALWENPELQKLVLHTENEEKFTVEAAKIRSHATRNENVLQALVKERSLSAGADNALAEIRKQLGAKWLIGAVAAVRVESEWYVDNLNVYAPQAFAMEQNLKKVLKTYGFSDALRQAVAARGRAEGVDFLDAKQLKQHIDQWKELSETNSSWLQEQVEKKQLTRTQWERIKDLEQNAVLQEPGMFQEQIRDVFSQKTTGEEKMSRDTYLYGEKVTTLTVESGVYRKLLEGDDLCEYKDFDGILSNRQMQVKKVLRELLKSGALTEKFPYLKQIKTLQGLDRLDYSQYAELSGFLRDNIARGLQSWSQIHCVDQEVIKEQLLKALMLGTYSEEVMQKTVQEHQQSLEQSGKIARMKLLSILGGEQEDARPFVFRYMKADGNANLQISGKRLERIRMAREMWDTLQKNGQDQIVISRLNTYLFNFKEAKKEQSSSGSCVIHGAEFRDYMSHQILKMERHGQGLYQNDKTMKAVLRLFDQAGKELEKERGVLDSVSNFFTRSKGEEEQAGLMLEFLMCGMEQELMTPGTCGEQLLYLEEDAAYDEGLSILTMSALDRLERLQEVAWDIYGNSRTPAARQQYWTLIGRLRSAVLLMEPEPGKMEPLDENMRKRNLGRFGAESIDDLYEQVRELAGKKAKTDIFERSDVREVSELCREREKLFKEHNNWSIELLLPYMTRDREIWTHMMMDNETAFLQFLEDWKQTHPALEVLKDAPEMYARQFVAERAGDILKSTEDQGYWKKELDSFVQTFDNRKIGGTSINDRLASWAEKYQDEGRLDFFLMIEAELRSSSRGFEALYDDEKLEKLFQTYENQYKKNTEALEVLMKEQQTPENEQKLFAMQLGACMIREDAEMFQKELDGRYQQFVTALKEREQEKEQAEKTEKNWERVREQMEQMREAGNAVIRTSEEEMNRLRDQYWKTSSVILAEEGIQEDITEAEAKKAEQGMKQEYTGTYAEAVIGCLTEISLANPKLEQKELKKRGAWLQDMFERIQNQAELNTSDEMNQNALLVFSYLNYYEKRYAQIDDSAFRNISEEWMSRRNRLARLKERLSKVKYPSLAAEKQDLEHCLQMGIFTLDSAQFEKLILGKMEYFENADKLYAIIDEETEDAEKLKGYSEAFRDRVRAGLRECLGIYTRGGRIGEEQEQSIRETIADCLTDQNKFRYLIQSEVQVAVVRWDDLKTEEKNGALVNRKDLERLIEESREDDMIDQYNQLNEDQRRLFAMTLMMSTRRDSNSFLFSARLAADLQDPEHTADWFIEQMKAYVNHEPFAPEVDYSAALAQLRKENGQMDKDAFRQAMSFTQLAAERYQDNLEKDWNRMTAGIPSIEAAWRLNQKADKHAAERLKESGKTMENAQQLKDWLQKQAEADKKKDVLKQLEKLKPAALHILIRILQDRTISDQTTGVSIWQMANGKTMKHVNEAGRQELFGSLTGEERGQYLSESQSEEFCTQAMRSLLSFQLRDDIDLRGRLLNEKDFKSGALKRKTMVDWELFSQAMSLTEEVENTMLRLTAVRSSSKIIEMVPNEQAKAGYRECQEHKITSREAFTEYIKKQAEKDVPNNGDAPAFLAGFLSLSEQEKNLFVHALKHRDILDVSRKNLVKNAFGVGEREFVNEEERNRLADRYIQNSYSETDIISTESSDYEEAMNSLFSTQISDDVDFAGSAETGLEEQHSYEKISLNGLTWSVETVRDTAIDWTLFSRALQFVNRTASEARVLQQDREIYYSMGNVLKGGRFETDTAFMRRNLSRSGSRWSRLFGNLATGVTTDQLSDYINDKFPFLLGQQKRAMLGIFAAVNQEKTDSMLKSGYVEAPEEIDWMDMSKDLSEKIDFTSKAGAYIGFFQKAVEIWSNGKDLYDDWKRSDEQKQYRENEKINGKEAQDKSEKLEKDQSVQQNERSREGLARLEKGLETAGVQARHEKWHALADSFVDLAKIGLGTASDPIFGFALSSSLEAGKTVARMLHQMYIDSSVLDKYLSANTSQKEKIAQLKEKLEQGSGLKNTYSDEELYEKAMGFESREELVGSVVLEIVRSILFAASRFNTQMSLKLQAIATMTLLGFRDDIGKTDSETAERIYQMLSGDAYK